MDENNGAYRLVGSDPYGEVVSIEGDVVVCGQTLSSWHRQRKWKGDVSICFFNRELSISFEKRRILRDSSGEWINGF